jgi:hypothetical protein
MPNDDLLGRKTIRLSGIVTLAADHQAFWLHKRGGLAVTRGWHPARLSDESMESTMAL